MKRKIALLLTVILLLSMSACGNNNTETTDDTMQATQQTDTLQTTEPANGSTTENTEPEATAGDTTPDPTTTPTTPVEGNTTTPTTTEPDATESAPTERPTEPTPTTPVVPTPTEPKPTVPTEPKPTEPKPTEPTPTIPAPTEPKPTAPAPTEPAPTVPTPTEPKPTEPVAKPYIIGLEVVSSNMPNAYYCSNGQDLLSRMYGGKNKAFQTGDSVTIRVNMSDGGSDFKISSYKGCTITQNGNLVTLNIDGSNQRANVSIEAYNESGRKVSKTIGFAVVRCKGSILENWSCIYVELKNYAVRIGLTWVNNGSDMTGYTHDDESKSITGYTVKGADDFVSIPGNSRWIEKALWVLDTYKSMGLTRVKFSVVLANGFQSIAE